MNWQKIKDMVDNYYKRNNMVASLSDAIWFLVVDLGHLLLLFFVTVIGIYTAESLSDPNHKLLFLLFLFLFVLNFKWRTPPIRYEDKDSE